jgi:hypothetical protein
MRSTANGLDSALVSEKLAALGSTITSPRGPFRARPAKIAFDLAPELGKSDLIQPALTRHKSP